MRQRDGERERNNKKIGEDPAVKQTRREEEEKKIKKAINMPHECEHLSGY